MPEQGSPTPSCLDRMPWSEAARRLAREPRLLLPVGALEQHGPHLPLGTNTFLAGAVASELSSRLGILHAPAFPYGVTLDGSERFSGTAGLRRKTLHRALNELLACWEDHGVSEFVLIAAHRSEPHLDALLLALTSESETTVFDLYAIGVDDLLAGEPGPEHAGELETSLMLHLAPERVVTDAIEDAPPGRSALATYRRGSTPTPPVRTRGVLGRPALASAARGELIFRRWVDTLVSALSR